MRFYRFARMLVNWFIHLMYHIEYIGREELPAEGTGYVLVSNHRSGYDPLFLLCGVKPTVHFMCKAELIRMPVLGPILRHAGMFGVERGSGDSAALDRSVELLQSGEIVGMFPEGTRSRTDQPLRPKSGAAHIAHMGRVGVLPCAVRFEGRLHFRSKVQVLYGKYIPYDDLGFVEGDEMNARALRTATKAMWTGVLSLLDLEG